MKRVNGHTRAGKRGKDIQCPHCGYRFTVYHFAWSALVCFNLHPANGCKREVKKLDWLVAE